MTDFTKLAQATRPWLTDGGLETWLFFQEGFSAPEFAAIVLMDDEAAKAAMRRYFDEFIALSETAETGFVLDTATWRGATIWAENLGMSQGELLDLSRKATEFALEIRHGWSGRHDEILVNGVIGPAGDGYAAGKVLSADEAVHTHRPQIETLAHAGVDMISAVTMTGVGEAIGIARVAAEVGLPSVLSFTVETDGRLPAGDPLGEAIEAVDAATDGLPAYYMVNCAHPDHFRDALWSGSAWLNRVGGLRANASRLSHAELDECEELDEGNPVEFGTLHGELADILPNLRVVGGCCGTDHRHVAHAARNVCVEHA